MALTEVARFQGVFAMGLCRCICSFCALLLAIPAFIICGVCIPQVERRLGITWSTRVLLFVNSGFGFGRTLLFPQSLYISYSPSSSRLLSRFSIFPKIDFVTASFPAFLPVVSLLGGCHGYDVLVSPLVSTLVFRRGAVRTSWPCLFTWLSTWAS